jgi:WXXGXW repeat (2 copies)
MKKYLMVLCIVSGFILMGCSAGYVVAQPADVTYARPVAPGPDYVWIGGEWEWTGGNYHWHEGSWQHAREGHTWKSGYWENNHKGYKWHKGSWQ